MGFILLLKDLISWSLKKDIQTLIFKRKTQHYYITPIVQIKIKIMKNPVDWKKMGFKSEKEYKEFMDKKMQKLIDKLQEPKIAAVFKRLTNR